MPDDLLQFVSGPPGYAMRWLWFGMILVVLVIGWYTAIFIATMPAARLRRMPVVRTLHSRVLRYRFARTVRAISRRRRDGAMSDAQASAALSRTLRSFLHQATGERAQYMQLRDLAANDLAAAVPVLTALGDAQFERVPSADVDRLGEQTEELIRSWS